MRWTCRWTWRTSVLGLALPAVLVLGVTGAVTGAGEAGWGPVEDVGAGPVDPGPYDARVAVATDGTVLAVWRAQGDRGGHRLLVARRPRDGGRWGPTKAVSGPIRWGRFDVAAGPRGTFSVVWERRVGEITRIEERHLLGRAWSPVARLGRGLGPSVAIDGSGSTLAVWGASALSFARRAAGGGWSDARQLVDEHAREPTVDVNEAGDAVVAWWTHRGREGRPWKARAMVERSGTWKTPSTIVDSPYWEPGRGSLAAEIGPLGRAIVLFVRLKATRRDGYRNAVVWSRSHEDGTWAKARFLTRELLEDGGRVALSMNGTGQALSTWSCSDSDGSHVEAARFRRDATWGDPRRIGPRGRWTWSADPWLDDAGGAHVTLWRGYAFLAFAQQPEEAWKGPVRIARGEYGDAAGQGGRMVAMWFGGGTHARVLDVD